MIDAAKSVGKGDIVNAVKDVAKGGKPGAFEGVGVTLAVSDATSVDDLGGLGESRSISGGAGLGGTLEVFNGKDSVKGTYIGGSVTVGEATGLSADSGPTATVIVEPPKDGQKTQCANTGNCF